MKKIIQLAIIVWIVFVSLLVAGDTFWRSMCLATQYPVFDFKEGVLHAECRTK